jgi:arylsulfatase A-like enzyme
MTNLILLLIDALRYDHVTPQITPNLMEFSKQGLFYENALAGNTATIKSIPCILCADFEYHPEENIASILKDEGYTTAALHSNPLFGENFPHGFDVCEDLHSHSVTGDRRVKKLARKLPHTLFKKIKEAWRAVSETDSYLPYMRAEGVLEVATEWIDKAPEPFFLWVHLMDPHMPYFPKDDLGLDRRELIKLNDKVTDAAYRKANLTSEETELAKLLYLKEVSEMDESLRKFFEAFDRENIMFITSDHGEEFGEFGDFSHHEDKFIPPLLHVPLIVAGGGVERGTYEKYFSHLEVAPKIFEMLRIDREIGVWKGKAR